MQPPRRTVVIALALLSVLVAYAFSVAIRLDTFQQHTGGQGLEATYHVLWTAQALANSSPETHFFLPTVTLSPDPDFPVPWGATVETRSGSHVYTSFPPLGFLVPYAASLLLGGDLSFGKLALLNSLFGLLAALGLGGLCRAVFLSATGDRAEQDTASWIVLAITASSYLFLREALVSHGAVYWPHSLSQIVFIFAAWIAFRILEGKHTAADLGALFLVCLLFPSLEWTGFVFNAGLFIAFAAWPVYVGRTGGQGAGRSVAAWIPPAVVLLATAIASMAILVHFSMAIGLHELMLALQERAVARTYGLLAIPGVAVGYFVSFGALVPIGGLAFFLGLRTKAFRSHPALAFLLFVTVFPMLENAVLAQHAYQFSFDRLKLAVPLALACAVAAAADPRARRAGAVLICLYIVISSNLQIFANDKTYYAPWGKAVAENAIILEAARADPLAACSIAGASVPVRGYLNLALKKDFLDGASQEELLSRARAQNACGLIVVESALVFANLPKIRAIKVYDPDGQLVREYIEDDTFSSRLLQNF